MDRESEPGAKYRHLIDSLDQSISIWDDPAAYLNRVRREIGYLEAAFWCQTEVCNGGFHQFFDNSTGVMAPEALEAFRAIGLSEWADLLVEAMNFFDRPYPRDRDERQKQLDRAPKSRFRQDWDPFYCLDERFYQWLHVEPYRWERAADAYASTITEEQGDKDSI